MSYYMTNQQLKEMVATSLSNLARVTGVFEIKLGSTNPGIFTPKFEGSLPSDRTQSPSAAPAA
jgi:hypothetical protein